VRVNFTLGEARTLAPQAELSVFDHFEYRFAKDGGAEAARTPQDGVFVLDTGAYTLKVNAYMSAGTDKLAASGTASFTVSAGANASVSLALQPVISGEGTGTFKYALAYPSGAVVESLSLTRIGGDESVDLKAGAVTTTTSLNGEKSVGVGYYLFTVSLSLMKTDGTHIQRRAEVVHIYQNMTAEALAGDYTFTAADFEGDIYVTSAADSGPGSLRRALANAVDGATIHVDLSAGSVIELASRLEISKNVIIQGNGLTLTRAASWTTVDYSSQLLNVSSGVTASIGRIHFKDGRAISAGGAISNEGNLTLESCIFSGNQTTSFGGAVDTMYGDLIVRGCTFYNNSSATYGGAIYSGRTTILSGNLFYGNTADGSGHVVAGSVTSTGYNVADRPKGSYTSGGSGFNHANDGYSNALPFAPLNFKVLNGGEAHGIIAALPENYPAVDFYGQPISAVASAGAVQAIAASGYAVFTSTNNSNGGINIAETPNADGLYSGEVSLTAVLPSGGYTLSRWLVNGVDSGAASPLALTLTGHVIVRAEFSRTVTVSSIADSGAGTLRRALDNAGGGDIITMETANQVIELASRLEISKNVTIQGNGLTLTRAASWTTVDYSSQLLNVSSGVTASIGRVHFKDGRAISVGGAISSEGNLTLESCIFSGNQTTSSGGAVDTRQGDLTVRGCTFYNNSSGTYGGAIYGGGETTTLSGNLFYGNTADGSGHVVAGTVTSAGYNVADRPKGSYYTSGQSGFDHANDDSFEDIGISGAPLNASTFAPVSGLGSFIPSAPPDFPLVDFYGETRTWPGAPGAVK
jgi:predicted outer membrane repeat protein